MSTGRVSGHVFVVLALGFAACGVPNSPNMNPGKWNTLQDMAARDLRCDRSDLEYEYRGNAFHRMTGCGRHTDYLLHCPIGCVWMRPPLRQASFNLDCPRGELTIVPLGSGHIGIEGCGERLSYVTSCTDRGACNWVLEARGTRRRRGRR